MIGIDFFMCLLLVQNVQSEIRTAEHSGERNLKELQEMLRAAVPGPQGDSLSRCLFAFLEVGWPFGISQEFKPLSNPAHSSLQN